MGLEAKGCVMGRLVHTVLPLRRNAGGGGWIGGGVCRSEQEAGFVLAMEVGNPKEKFIEFEGWLIYLRFREEEGFLAYARRSVRKVCNYRTVVL